MSVRIELPPPHSQIQKVIMESFLDPDGPDEVFVSCGTKFGKTMACSVALGAALPRFPMTQWRWVAPYYSQAVIGYDNLKNILPKQFVKCRKSNMSIEVPTIDTICKFVHAQNAEQLEGHQIHGYIIDEAAKVTEQVYYSARTTVTRTRSAGMGKFLIPSTPLGRNWFFRLCMEAKNEMELAALNNRKPRQVFFTAPTASNPFISPTVIEDAKVRLPERLFRQYYLAEWLDDSSTFTNVVECMFGEPFMMKPGKYSLWLDSGHADANVVIGADWARGREKSADSTVFTAINYEASPPRVVGIMKLKGLNYTEQMIHLVRFSRNFEETHKVCHDKTGVGVAIDDQLELTGLVYEGQHFSLQSKSEMVCNIITAFEQKRLMIPHCADLKSELDSYQMEVTDDGKMKFGAAPGTHDDMVTSLMLAWNIARKLVDTNVEFRRTDQIKDSAIKSFYDDIISDDDEEHGDWIETIMAVRAGK